MITPDHNGTIKGVVQPFVDAASLSAGKEVSLKYLHRNWADIHEIDKTGLENLVSYIFKIQEGKLNAATDSKVSEPGAQWISMQKELKKVLSSLPESIRTGKPLKIKISGKARAYFMHEDLPNSDKVYLLAIDAKHKIAGD